VVGVKGTFDSKGKLVGMGIRCSLCHSTVDDSFAPGIGKRRDGWANRDLNVGAIVSLSPGLGAVAGVLGVDEPTLKKVLAGWGPGKFDAEMFMDGKALRPDGATGATLIPSAFGLAGVNEGTLVRLHRGPGEAERPPRQGPGGHVALRRPVRDLGGLLLGRDRVRRPVGDRPYPPRLEAARRG
jgi:hypothetical protein